MANTTRAGALSIHGTNPQYLVPTVIRQRVYDTLYWKEHCFALNPATIIDQAVQLSHVGGTYANTRPTDFMCLVLKLLQLQPEREVVLEYLRAEEFKYLRALAAFYVRLTFDSLNVYEVLEPLLDDYRKLRFRAMDGSYHVTTLDQFADDLLHSEMVCEIQLPRLTQRKVLEETEGLATRSSKLAKAMGVKVSIERGGRGRDGDGDEDGDESASGEEEDEEGERGARYLSRSPSESGSEASAGIARSRSASFDSLAGDERRQGRGRSRSRSRSRSTSSSRGGRYVSRSPSGDRSGDEAVREEGGGGARRSTRYVSRSPTPGSPEPETTIEVERIEGDV